MLAMKITIELTKSKSDSSGLVGAAIALLAPVLLRALVPDAPAPPAPPRAQSPAPSRAQSPAIGGVGSAGGGYGPGVIERVDVRSGSVLDALIRSLVSNPPSVSSLCPDEGCEDCAPFRAAAKASPEVPKTPS